MHKGTSKRVMSTEFCQNIFARPYDIKHIEFQSFCFDNQSSFYGWHISEEDCRRIRRLTELDSEVEEFERLAKKELITIKNVLS